MTDEEHKAKVQAVYAWARRHGYHGPTFAGAYERNKPAGGIERIKIDGMVVRYEVFCSDYTRKCPFFWHTLREGWIHEIEINPVTDKMKGME